MVQSDEERKVKQREYYYKNKEKFSVIRKEHDSRPEEKAKRKTPEAKAKRKAKRDTPAMKLKAKEYAQSDKVKAREKARSQTPERKTYRKEYFSRPEVKAREKARSQTPEVKAKQKESNLKYRSRPEVKAKKKNIRDDVRLNILQAYSKRLSNSNVPCCNCCGLNDHLAFLAIDHIAGAKHMDFEPELVKLGYSSKLKSKELNRWIIDHNFPDGFQILCHNCNFAKGYPRNNGKCPHNE